MKVGLFFGSFNPIHIGHMAIANYMVEYSDISQLWFIVSPHNPLKRKATLLEDHHRLEMVRMAIGDDMRFQVSDIEFRMPKPSYTIDTLTYLKAQFPGYEFVIIMGSDGLPTFKKWKNYEQIISLHKRLVYPRPGEKIDMKEHPNIEIINAPQMEVSSSFIRQAIIDQKDIRYFLPNEKIYQYILDMHFYE
ncbi:MAG: nicotinate-nucleotide adenylyltransferase [Bacteroidales bacterium]|nr:nicotinate-nucleotide adenylyltransferase [Bacteroidales bacterium]